MKELYEEIMVMMDRETGDTDYGMGYIDALLEVRDMLEYGRYDFVDKQVEEVEEVVKHPTIGEIFICMDVDGLETDDFYRGYYEIGKEYTIVDKYDLESSDPIYNFEGIDNGIFLSDINKYFERRDNERD